MKKLRRAPSYAGLAPSSDAASAAAKGASRKRDTTPEMMLRRALWADGLRYRVAARDLPGRPDIVFRGPRVAVFCDGDFWHGRDLRKRLTKLHAGHNASYWVAKIEANFRRDRSNDAKLARAGWLVVRLWESEIRQAPQTAAKKVLEVIRSGAPRKRRAHGA